MDEGSDALLGELVGSVEGTKTLVVVNFRPEYTPSWGELAELPPDPAEPLGTGRHQRAAARPGRRRPLARRARRPDPRADRGQPVLHRGDRPRAGREPATWRASAAPTGWSSRSSDIGVPASVQTILAARIDRLDADAKQLLQATSVVGKEVPEPALMRISPGSTTRSLRRGLCKELIDAGFLYEAELYPERVLAFRHPLTREVAYGTQLAEQRAADPRRGGAGDDRPQPRPPRRAGGADRPPLRGGRRDAGGGALVRPRRPLGGPQPAPRRDAAVGTGDRSGLGAAESQRRPRRSASPRACCSSTTPGGSGWRRNGSTPWSRRPARSQPGPVTCAR